MLGLPEELKNIKDFDLDTFLGYCNKEFNSYYMNKDKPLGEIGDYLAKRYALADAFAKAFGIENLCMKSKFVAVEFPHSKTKFEILMNEASGLSIDELLEKFGNNLDLFKIIDPNFQKDLTSLQFVDMLLWTVDHAPYNYKVICENNRLKSICCYDHKAASYDASKLYRPSIKENSAIDPLNLNEKFYHNVS